MVINMKDDGSKYMDMLDLNYSSKNIDQEEEDAGSKYMDMLDPSYSSLNMDNTNVSEQDINDGSQYLDMLELPSTNVEQLPEQQTVDMPEEKSGLDSTIDKIITPIGKGVAGTLTTPRQLFDLMGLQESMLDMVSPKIVESVPQLYGVKLYKAFKDYNSGDKENKTLNKYLPSYEQVYNQFKEMGLPDVEAETGAGKLGQTILEFISASPSKKWKTILDLTVSAIGSDILGNLAEGTSFEPASRAIGSVLGGSTAAGVRAIREPKAQKELLKNVREIPEEELRSAQKVQEASQELGMPLSAAEAIDSPTLRQKASNLAQTEGGAPVFENFMRDRASKEINIGDVNQTRKLGTSTAVPKKFIDQITEGNLSPDDVAYKIREGAKKAIVGAEKSRTAQTQMYYNIAKDQTVTKDQVQSLKGLLDTQINEASDPNLRKYFKSIKNELGLAQKGVKGNEIKFGKVSDIFKYARDSLKQRNIGDNAIAKNARVKAGQFLDEMQGTLENISKDYVLGNKLYSEISKEIVDPLKRSKIGQLSGNILEEQPAIAASLNDAIAAVSNIDTVRPQDIKQVASELNKVDKTLFPSIVKVYLQKNLDKSTKELISGAPQNVGAKFRKAIYGTDQQKENLKELISQVAVSNNQNPNKVWRGWNKMLTVMERSGTIPGVGSQTQPRQALQQQLSQNVVSDILEIPSFNPGKVLSDRQKIKAYERSSKQMAELLTQPDSVKKLSDLANLSTTSARAKDIAIQLIQVSRELQQED